MYSGPITHDDRGNLTAHSGKTYDYDIFNKLPLPGPFTSIFDSQDQKLSLRDTASKASVAGTSAQSGNMLNVTYAYDAKGLELPREAIKGGGKPNALAYSDNASNKLLPRLYSAENEGTTDSITR